jgi:hypothetical protein
MLFLNSTVTNLYTHPFGYVAKNLFIVIYCSKINYNVQKVRQLGENSYRIGDTASVFVFFCHRSLEIISGAKHTCMGYWAPSTLQLYNSS